MLWPHTKAEVYPPMAGQNAVHRMPTWGTSYGKNRIQNVECRTIFSSDPSTVLGVGF